MTPRSFPPHRGGPRAGAVAAAATTLALLAGCGPPFVVTDSFTAPPTGLFSGPTDSLHDYVVGTAVTLDVRTARPFVDLDAVEVVSKNPDLVVIESQTRVEDRLVVVARAVAAGTASIAFLDRDQRPMEERVVEVKLPDEILLDVNIDTTSGYTIPVIDGDNLLVAVGGEVTYRVTYRNAGAEVKGVGVLVGISDVVTMENPTRASPDREFLTLRAPPTPTELSDALLTVAGQSIRNLRVRLTPLEEIATIQLDEGDISGWRNGGEVSVVWAKAFTAGGAPIFGTPIAWSVDGAGLTGSGDLLQYTYEPGQPKRLQVSAGPAVADLTVEARAGTAIVGSTANAGCAQGPGAPLVALLVLLVPRASRRALNRSGAARRGTLPS